VLSILTVLLVFRARDILDYTVEAGERRFFNTAVIAFSLSLLDLMFVGCKLFMYVVPLRLQHYRNIKTKKDNVLDEKMILFFESISNLLDLLVLITAVFVGILTGPYGWKMSYMAFKMHIRSRRSNLIKIVAITLTIWFTFACFSAMNIFKPWRIATAVIYYLRQ
jgi:hypothetical protein